MLENHEEFDYQNPKRPSFVALLHIDLPKAKDIIRRSKEKSDLLFKTIQKACGNTRLDPSFDRLGAIFAPHTNIFQLLTVVFHLFLGHLCNFGHLDVEGLRERLVINLTMIHSTKFFPFLKLRQCICNGDPLFRLRILKKFIRLI